MTPPAALSGLPSSGEWLRRNTSRPPRSTPRAVGAVLLALAIVMLLATTGLGILVVQQTGTLRSSVAFTQEAVDANVRTLGQAQRELLRLRALLIVAAPDAAAIGLTQSFVDQRLQEGALPYQGQTLGSDELLSRSADLAAQWTAEVRPAVAAAVASDDPAALAAAADRVAELEKNYNQLVSDGEINRKMRAGKANEETRQLLGQTDRLMLFLAVTAGGFLVFLAVAGYASQRSRRQREKAAAELVALNAELRTHALVVHATDNLVVITDADGRIEWVNDAFARTTGYSLEAAHGQCPGRLLQGPATDPATVAVMHDAVLAGEDFAVEVLNYTATGRPYWVHIEAHAVHDDAGQVNRYVAIQTDVTDRRLMEQQLRDATDTALSLAQEKSAFLATMSHEIRTPLNAVLGVTALLKDTELDEEQQEYVCTAQRSGNLLLALVNDILDFSALDSGRIEIESRPFLVRSLMADVTSLFATTAAAAGLELTVEVQPDVPAAVESDENRIRQVLLNLIANGLKFTRDGGVRVVVGFAPGPDGGALRFSVQDTGIGIAADRQERIFLPFTQVDATTTRTYGGTGLGLSICRLIAQHLDGTLELTSMPGRGSTFTFTVPVGPAGDAELPVDITRPAHVSRPSDETRPGDVTPPVTELAVLLAEDDATNRMVALRMLSRLGVRADVAVDGQEAVDAVRGRNFDLVLMDVHMPRLDGIAATARIRELTAAAARTPRIVAVTANALEGDSERLIAAGMDGYLSKPVTAGALKALLSAVAAGEAMPGTRPPQTIQAS
ncbi:ATP-binding protein [Nakamurella sp. GG22]